MWEKDNTYTLLLGVKPGRETLWKQLYCFLSKLKIHLPKDPVLQLLHYSKDFIALLQRYLLIHASCCSFQKSQKFKQSRNLSTDQWIMKIWNAI